MTTSFNSTTSPTNLATSQAISTPTNDQPQLPSLSQSQTQTQPQPSLVPFPSPQTFTFLPQLYQLISRLAPLQSSHPTTTTAAAATSSTAGSRTSRSPTLIRRPAPLGTDGPSGSAATASSLTQTRSRDETVIEPKDLPGLVYPLRQHIERAKQVVKTLPDVDRGLGEQEAEIEMLEARIRGLKGRLKEVGRVAGEGRVKRGEEEGDDEDDGGDVVMLGVEG